MSELSYFDVDLPIRKKIVQRFSLSTNLPKRDSSPGYIGLNTNSPDIRAANQKMWFVSNSFSEKPNESAQYDVQIPLLWSTTESQMIDRFPYYQASNDNQPKISYEENNSISSNSEFISLHHTTKKQNTPAPPSILKSIETTRATVNDTNYRSIAKFHSEVIAEEMEVSTDKITTKTRGTQTNMTRGDSDINQYWCLPSMKSHNNYDNKNFTKIDLNLPSPTIGRISVWFPKSQAPNTTCDQFSIKTKIPLPPKDTKRIDKECTQMPDRHPMVFQTEESCINEMYSDAQVDWCLKGLNSKVIAEEIIQLVDDWVDSTVMPISRNQHTDVNVESSIKKRSRICAIIQAEGESTLPHEDCTDVWLSRKLKGENLFEQSNITFNHMSSRSSRRYSSSEVESLVSNSCVLSKQCSYIN